MGTGVEDTTFRGIAAWRLTAADGASALVAHHGAHVLSWIPARRGERLYLSERSTFAPGQAIRGGIPVIFPQFATTGPLPRHGFARTLPWNPIERHVASDHVRAVWRLEASPATLTHWPARFAAEVTVLVGGDRLDVELAVENTGDTAFDFTTALHTYCRVEDVELAVLHGLADAPYRDHADGNRARTDTAPALQVAGEVDRLYPDAPAAQTLVTGAGRLAIEREGFPDVVVWNPWESKCAALSDMPPDGFRRMLCVEAGAIHRPVTLAPGGEWHARQSLDAGQV